MQDFVPTVSQISKLGYNAKGVSNAFDRASNLGSRAVVQVEPYNYELARSTRLFVGTLAGVANGVVPVVDVPTTTAPVMIFNNAAAGNGSRVLVPIHVGMTIASGTTGAGGFTLIAAVSAAIVASPPTANSTGCTIQATRGAGTSVALMRTAFTIPSGSSWAILDGLMTTAVAVTGCGKGFDLRGMFVVPAGFGFAFGAMGDTGTTAKYCFSCIWAEIECDLDT